MQTLDFPLSHFITAWRIRLCAQLWLRRAYPLGTWSELDCAESHSAYQLLLRAGPSTVHQLTATDHHGSAPSLHRIAAGGSVCVSLARVTRLLYEVRSAKSERDHQLQQRIKRWVTGGEEQIQTPPRACSKVPVVMVALAIKDRTCQWYRDCVGQGRGGITGRWQGLWEGAYRAYWSQQASQIGTPFALCGTLLFTSWM